MKKGRGRRIAADVRRLLLFPATRLIGIAESTWNAVLLNIYILHISYALSLFLPSLALSAPNRVTDSIRHCVTATRRRRETS